MGARLKDSSAPLTRWRRTWWWRRMPELRLRLTVVQQNRVCLACLGVRGVEETHTGVAAPCSVSGAVVVYACVCGMEGQQVWPLPGLCCWCGRHSVLPGRGVCAGQPVVRSCSLQCALASSTCLSSHCKPCGPRPGSNVCRWVLCAGAVGFTRPHVPVATAGADLVQVGTKQLPKQCVCGVVWLAFPSTTAGPAAC